MQRGQPGQNMRGDNNATVAAILSSLQSLTAQVTTIATKMDALGDTFMPRREMTEIVSGLKDRQADFHARLTAMEEWRLSETTRQAQAQLTVQTAITKEASEAKRESFQARISSVSGINALILVLLGAMASGFISMLVYIVSHH